MFTLKQLHYALAVWSEGTFVQAAAKVHVSQPAISEQVSQLETEIGFDLFRRTGHGVEVTDLGRAFLMEAEEAYHRMLRLSDTATQLRGGQGGRFAIGLSSGVTPFLIPEIIHALADVTPKLRLEVVTTTTRQIYQHLQDDSFDIGMTVETNPRALPRELLSERVASDSMVLIAQDGHRLSKRRSVELKDLVDEPLIMNELSVGYSEIVLSMFNDLDLRIHFAATCDNFDTIVTMVRAGAGVAIVPRRGAGVSARYGGLAVIPTKPEFSVHVTLVRHMRTMSPAAESYTLAIRNHLLEVHGSS